MDGAGLGIEAAEFERVLHALGRVEQELGGAQIVTSVAREFGQGQERGRIAWILVHALGKNLFGRRGFAGQQGTRHRQRGLDVLELVEEDRRALPACGPRAFGIFLARAAFEQIGQRAPLFAATVEILDLVEGLHAFRILGEPAFVEGSQRLPLLGLLVKRLKLVLDVGIARFLAQHTFVQGGERLPALALLVQGFKLAVGVVVVRVAR